ncbi:MAG: MerR family transcriptional regulator [Clostridia bacterium]|nr:MerR family transcriptional regulator [Clostridia bacterium]
MYKIGELSRLCRLPVKTLRYYADEGLLLPDMIDRFTGYRYYSASKLADCNRIVALKELGFSLDEIRRHMGADEREDVLMLIEAKQAELTRVIERTDAQLRRLDTLKRTITEGENKMYDVVIRNSDSIRVAYVRKIFASREDAYAELELIRSSLPANIVGRRNLIVNHETEWRECNFDFAVCVEITAKLPQRCGYFERTITLQGDIASLVCRDDELEAARTDMTKQLYELPAQIVGAFYEFYHEDGTVELKVPIVRLSRSENTDAKDEFYGEFLNDAEAVGMWELLDIVPSREQFSFHNRKFGDIDNVLLRKLYFLPQGEGYWFINGWTKGFIYTKNKYKSAYEIESVNGETLMFVHLKECGYYTRGGRPSVYVYHRCDSKEYKKSDIRIYDDVDYPFISDECVLGKWSAYDCIRMDTENNYDPSEKQYGKELFFTSAEFHPDGNAKVTYGGKEYDRTWTKGLLLHKNEKKAEAYDIREINGREYLFIEWKSGDYVFGGRVIGCYVFVRG